MKAHFVPVRGFRAISFLFYFHRWKPRYIAKAIQETVMTTLRQTITCYPLSTDKCQIGGCLSPAADS